MAKIKSVKTSSGKRVQIGSKAYNKRIGAGESVVSGTGKNLGGSDIRNIQKTQSDYTDEVSTTRAKREANAEGELLPYQKEVATPMTPIAPEMTPAEQKVPYEQAQQNLAQGGLGGATLASAQQNLATSYGKSKYEVAHQALQGTQAPADAGQAMAQAFNATPYEPDQTQVDQVFDQDPVINQLMGQAYELLNPEVQKTSLMQDYKKLYKSSGLDEINEELIDAETILDGTEDDIRNEIQTAGGLATDSQVMSMTLSRNKGILKRYNQLFSMKQSAEQQLQTMLNITQQDRLMAEQRVTNQINTMFQFANFRQQSQNAYKETARWALTTMGADNLYASMKGSPQQVANYEKMMGLPAGGLAVASAQASRDRANQQYLQNLQIKKAEQDVGIGLPETPEGQIPPDILNKASEGERKGLGFLNRARDASDTLAQLEEENFDFGASRAVNEAGTNIPVVGGIRKGIQSEDYRKYKQAAETWIKATLRLESGASIPTDELESYFTTYFPSFGDSKAVREQKAQARVSAESGLGDIAGRLAPYAKQSFNPASFYGE